MNQADFAREIQRSIQMLQLYERGTKPPPEVIETLKSIAVRSGRPDLAAALVGDQQDVRRSPETIATVPKPVNPRSSQHWHDLLDAILQSGNSRAITAVQSNLIVFGDYVGARPRRSPDAQRKAKG